MLKAIEENTPSRLTPEELAGLADRFKARAASAMFSDQPNLRTDMLMAARVLRTMVRSLKPGDVMELIDDRYQTRSPPVI